MYWINFLNWTQSDHSINIPGSSINQKPNSAVSVILCTGATFVKKLLLSCWNSFIWYCRSASTYFPYFRVILVQRFSDINGVIIVSFKSYLDRMLLRLLATKMWWWYSSHIDMFQSHVVNTIFQILRVRPKFNIR